MTTPIPNHRRALAEAQAWVMARLGLGNPAKSLRSAELGACLSGYPDEWLYSEIKVDEVKALIARRRELLPDEPYLLPTEAGRILIIQCGEDTAMGEGAGITDYLIDDTYFPSWDTWFAVLEGQSPILLSWIPKALVSEVQKAIDVSASQHIGWLDEVVSGVWGAEIGYTSYFSDLSRAALAEVLTALQEPTQP